MAPGWMPCGRLVGLYLKCLRAAGGSEPFPVLQEGSSSCSPSYAFEDEGLFCSAKFAVSINQCAPEEGALSNGVQRC